MSLNLELWLPTVEYTFFILLSIILLAIHVTSILSWILDKSYLKPKISLYLIQLHGLGSRPKRSSIHKADYQSTFSLLHRLVSSNDSRLTAHIISLILMESSFSNKNSYLHKTTPKPIVQSPWRYYLIKTHGSSSWHIFSFSTHEFHWGNFGSRGLGRKEGCSLKLQPFKVDNKNMLLGMSSPTPWTLRGQCIACNIL